MQLLRRERKKNERVSELAHYDPYSVRSWDSNWYYNTKISKTKCMGLLEIGEERKRSSHRLIEYQSNVGRVKNAHRSWWTKRKMKLKMNVWLRPYSGLSGLICVQRVHCMSINVWVCIVHGSKQCHMQFNVECFWNSIETIYMLTLTTAMKFFSFVVFSFWYLHWMPWRFRTMILLLGHWIHSPFL